MIKNWITTKKKIIDSGSRTFKVFGTRTKLKFLFIKIEELVLNSNLYILETKNQNFISKNVKPLDVEKCCFLN